MTVVVARPATINGVMAFIVNQDGRIFEKDLGKDSAELGAKMTAFDPGPGWREVEP